MYDSEEEINKEKNKTNNVSIPNHHLTVGTLTSTDDDIKIIPKSLTSKPIKKQIHILDYTPDSLLADNKVEEFVSFIRNNYLLQKLIFDKDLFHIERLLERTVY